jgi:hypothetical protein
MHFKAHTDFFQITSISFNIIQDSELMMFRVKYLHVEVFPALLISSGTEPIQLLEYMDDLGYVAYLDGDMKNVLNRSEFDKFIRDCGTAHRDLFYAVSY